MKKLKVFNNAKWNVQDLAMMAGLIIAVIVLFVISVRNYNDTYDGTIENEKGNVTRNAESCSREIEAFFNEKFALLEYLATLPEINGMNWTEQYQYAKGKETDLGFEQIFFMDTAGKGYYVRDHVIRNQAGEEFHDNVMNNDRYITEPFMDYGSGTSITTLCASIYVNGEKVGAVCATLDLAQLFEIVESMQEEDGYAVLINGVGEFVASSDMTLVHKKQNFKTYYKDTEKNEISLVSNYIDSISGMKTSEEFATREVHTGDMKLEGVEYFTTLVPIDNCSWTIILTREQSAILGNIESTYWTMIVSVVILLVVILLVIKFVTKLNSKEKMAFIDQLTGIPNRARCNIVMDKLETFINESVMLVNFDLNDFKGINDEYGHKVGDEALKSFSKALTKTFGKYGFVGRMGGDEFVAILVNVSQEQYEKILAEFKTQMNSLNSNRNQKFLISTSYGNAIRKAGNPEDQTIHNVYELADKNMYIYKEMYKSMKAEK